MTSPVYDQDAFQGGHTGTVNSATFDHSLNGDYSQGTGTANKKRVRFVIQQTNASKTVNNQVLALYKNYDSGGWAVVDASTSSHVRLVDDDDSIADNATTTQVIGSGTYSTGDSLGFDDGTSDVGTGDCDFNGAQEVEAEFCYYLVDADVANDKTLQLRVELDGGTDLNSYTNTPTVTVIKTVTLTISETDSAAPSDTATVDPIALPINESDALTVVDIVRYYADAVVLGESTSVTVVSEGPATLTISEADAVSLGDTATVDPLLLEGVVEADSATPTDVDTVRLQLGTIVETDSATPGESQTVTLVNLIGEADSAEPSDSATVEMTRALTASDSATPGESVSVEIALEIAEADAVPVIDDYGAKLRSLNAGGLIAHFQLSESSGTTADNAQGNSTKDGTYKRDVSTMGTETGIGDGNTAPTFDGAGNDSVNIDSTALEGDFDGDVGSLLVWGKVDAAGRWSDASIDAIVRLQGNGTGNHIFLRKNSAPSGDVQFYRQASSTVSVVVFATGSPTAYFFMAMTWDTGADEFKAFWNGAQVGSTQTSLGTWSGTAFDPAIIGAATSGGGESWGGPLAHGIILNEVLTPAQIEEAYRVFGPQLTVSDLQVSVSDSATPGESTAVELTIDVVESDALTPGDSATVAVVTDDALAISESDSAAPGEAQAVELTIEIAETDSAAPGDSASVNTVYNIVEADSATPGEAQTVELVSLIAEADSAAPGESTTVTVSNPQITEADAISLGESTTVTVGAIDAYLISVADSAAPSEVTTVAPLILPISEADAISLTDSAIARLFLFPSASDAVSVADVASITPLVIDLSTSEAVSVGELSVVALPGFVITGSPDNVAYVLYVEQRSAVRYEERRAEVRFEDHRAEV